jgi:UDP-GlcNAc:undecaprenyl-phosphate GlcNAc-1-phosphate transferase
VPNAFWPFFSALIFSLALCPLVAKLATRSGIVSVPAKDRWQRPPTPLLGGLAIAAGTVFAVALFGDWDRTVWVMIGASSLALILGVVDDWMPLGATAKLVGSLAIGGVVISLFSTGAGFTPPATTILLAIVWFAGVVHSFNLLDNMDGLAAGVGAIIAAAAALVLSESGHGVAVVVLVSLAGALAGFLPWNSYPARMFMGDGGSLFIGSILGAASLIPWLTGEKGPSLWSYALLVAFIVPVGETAFVSALRWLAGRNPARGGVDHPSHRLVAMGFSERRAVLFFYAAALASGVVAAWLATSGPTALPIAAVFIVGIVLGSIHLARVPTYQGDDFVALQRVPYGDVLSSAFLRSHAVQVLLDLLLITASYYAAYRIRFEGEGLEIFLPSFTASLPIVLVCKAVAHYAAGLYGRSWSTFGVGDVPAVTRAVVLGSTASVIAATYLFRFERFSRGVFIIDAVLLLVAILGSRLSFRFMAHAAVMQSTRARRVLICGTGERGRLLAREMLANTAWHMKPVGFVDARAVAERSILGIRVAGSLDDLSGILERLRVEGIVFSGDPIDDEQRARAARACAAAGVPVHDLIFDIRQATAAAGAP